MDIYCTLWVVIQCYFISFVTQTGPALVTGSSFNWLLCPFDIWRTPIIVCVSGDGYISYLLEDFWCQISDAAETQTDPSPFTHPCLLLLGFHILSPGCTSDHGGPRSCWTHLNFGPCPFLPPQPLPCRNNALSPGWVCLPVPAPENFVTVVT